MSDIITPHEALLDPSGRDILRERQEMKRNQAAILRLARLTQAPFCGMTSRPAPYHRVVEIQWGSYVPPIPMTMRASCTEVVHEMTAWANWLVRALSVVKYDGRGHPHPVPLAEVSRNVVVAPPSRVFTADVWPALARP